MHPYRVDVSSILEDLGASEYVDGAFPLDRLLVGDAEFWLLEPARFAVTLTNTGSGIVVTGAVSARATTECSRCLEPFELLITGEVEGFYVQHGLETDVPEEQEVELIFPDNTIDLAPALLAALTVEAPFAPVHDESCAGLCPLCGCDLNVEHCDCHDAVPETHPFAALRDLLEEDPGSHANER